MTPELLSILAGAAVCAITAWLAFVKGWIDAAFGGPHHPGHKNDTWHFVARYGQYWPSLLAIPVGIAIGHFVGLWPMAGALPPLLVARALFRYGVWRADRIDYQDWYCGKDRTARYNFWKALRG